MNHLIKSVWILALLGWCQALALDPFLPPEQWDQFQTQIIKERSNEKPVWTRPPPGISPIVVIQTLILPEFEVNEVSPDVAFDIWQQACQRLGVEVRVYLEPSMMRNRPLITHSAKGETAARALSFIQNLSLARVKLVNDHLLAGIHNDLDPHELYWRVWRLSPTAAQLLKLKKPAMSGASWTAAEDMLKKQGAAFPHGTYADYLSDIHSLVAINTKVNLNSIAELIEELESRATIEAFKGKGVTQMDGYSLNVRSYKLQKSNVSMIHARLKDKEGRLVPFAFSTQTWGRWRGLISPVGSAAWLDLSESTLWLRNRPEQLDEFEKTLRDAEK
ncbi:MAG: hypothetical protein RL693_1905 [Verrucomicrobiota bacterium]|jgi:hypothetical protein